MSDLNTVRKVIIALINQERNGILIERLNAAYSLEEGCQIPFAAFGYASLHSFLDNELKANIRIVRDALNCKLYPIPTEKSGHIVKLMLESKDNKKKNSGPRPQR